MLSLDELRVFIAQSFPRATVTLESAAERRARLRLEVNERHLRPGGTVSGPVLMTLADAATYVALVSEIGTARLAVTSSLSISFLRRPRPGRALVAEAELLKMGRRLAVGDVRIHSDGEPDPVAQATVTYAISEAGP